MVYRLQTGIRRAKRKISVATIGLAALVFPVVLALSGGGAKAAVGGPICNVPVDYSTIQAAVSDPGCTIVNVAAGTYTENVTIGHSLTLDGARAGVDARTRSGAESVLNGNITVNANNVTVDGFTVNNAVATGAFVMLGGNSGEAIKNNIINNSGSAVSFDTSSTTLSQNAVKSNASATEGFQASTAPLSNLTVSDNSFSGANSATYNADVTVIEGNSNVVISGNSSTGDGTLIALFKTNVAQITGNTVVGAANSSAIYIGGGDSNVTVSGNQVSSAVSAVKVANSFGVGPNSNVTVTGNTLHNNHYGVNVAAGSENGTVAAHMNSITGNTVFGILNDPASGVSTLNGTCNWWGAANGPGPVGTGSGDKVSTGVTFAPWLVTSNLSGSCIGGNIATNKDQCKNDGWTTLTRADGSTFKNQGDCIQYVNTGR